MSRIDELIRELCSEGINWGPIGEKFGYEQPTKYLVNSTNYVELGAKVLTAGQTFVLGYTDETDGIYNASPDSPVIIFDDFTTGFQWVEFPFKAKSSAMKMITARSGSATELRFLFHWLSANKYTPSNHARHWISVISRQELPYLPIEIQEDIVQTLDTFTELEGELKGELKARTTQYEETRNRLMAFDDVEGHPLSGLIRELCPEGVLFTKLSEVTNLSAGDRVTKANMSPSGNYPVYGAGNVPTGRLNEWNHERGLIFSRAGAGAGFVNFIGPKFWATDVCFVARDIPGGPLIKFVYYWMKSNERELMKRTYGGSLPKIDKRYLWDHPVPVPPMPVQEEIVRILDAFDSLVGDLSSGLPAEIVARRKQYEHYRDKLLSFEDVAA